MTKPKATHMTTHDALYSRFPQTDGVGGGGGTSKHWLSAALRSVQSQKRNMCWSLCVFVMISGTATEEDVKEGI